MVLADVGDSFQRGVDEFFAFLPNLLGALIVLIIGYIVAKLVAGLVLRGLRAAGADRALATGTAGDYKQRFAPSLQISQIVAKIAFWFVFGLAILLAVSVLGIEALTDALAGIVGYLPNVIAAILILLVAIAIAGAVGGLASRLLGGTMLGKLVQTAVPALIITIALFMALVQLKIAIQIVVATYVLVLGAIALGFALAFGLGGRDVAREMLMGAYRSGQEKMPQMKAEAEKAKEEASAKIEQVRAETEGSSGMAETRTVRPSDDPGSSTRPAS
ncbi:MAG: transporter [Actinobacteria bacterium]|nr:transporter [Actinomycetota bacterium]